MKECIFCKIINGDIPTRTVYEDNDIIVFMDNDPSQNGHMLIVPKKHYTDFTELDNDIILKINEVTKKMKDLIYERLNADGIRLVNNYGLYQVVKHYHLHIIPAYKNKQEIINIDEVYSKLK
ncbi:MAG: HIT domain-containing protein [Bacilli bacterium]|nr:HIT domain-containing protein [Bacilli bacterium]